MRRFAAIARTTALEILSEPFVLLVMLASLALAILAPTLHCHQFGEPTRMARDAALSAILVGGVAIAVFATIRTFRREIETGTAQTALVHAVSRPRFFLAKVTGCFAAYAFLMAGLVAVSQTLVVGAAIGGAVAALKGDVAQMWGPSLSVASASVVVPLAAGAALNRFRRFRFTLTANVWIFLTALAGLAYRFQPGLALRFVPAAVLMAAPAVVFLAAAACFAVRFKANAAAAWTVLVIAAFVPAMGNYCLSDALANGGRIPWGYFFAALGALVPAVAGFLVLGAKLVEKKEV